MRAFSHGLDDAPWARDPEWVGELSLEELADLRKTIPPGVMARQETAPREGRSSCPSSSGWGSRWSLYDILNGAWPTCVPHVLIAVSPVALGLLLARREG